MKYISKLSLIFGLLSFLLALPVAGAQSLGFGSGLGNLSLGGSSSQNQQSQTLDKIVAVVNDDVILKSELDAAVAQLKQRDAGQIGQIPPNVLRSQVLDQLIMRKLQIQKADEDGIKVSKAELQQGLSRIAQRNNMTLQQFKQAVAQSGMSMSDLRQRVRDEIKVSKVRQKEVMQKVAVSDQDVNRYLQNQSLRVSRNHQYHLRQIKLNLPAGAKSTATGVVRDRLENLRQQITSGKTRFADAARKVSQGQHASDGGDLGWVSGSKLPDSFDSALAGLNKGQISSVFRGPDGFYLIKLEDERGNHNTSSGQNQNKVMVTEAHVRHIILQPNEIRSDARTRKLAQQIHQRLLAGDDFATLARKYSDDKSTARQGGDVGWVPIKRLPPDTQQHIANLHKGEISPIFQTQGGYEIIKLVNRRQRDETQEAERKKARQTLGRKRAGEKGDLWLRKLRAEAYVDIRMSNYQPTPGTPGS